MVSEAGIDSYVRIGDVSKATEVVWKRVGRKEKGGWQQSEKWGKNGCYDVLSIMSDHMC